MFSNMNLNFFRYLERKMAEEEEMKRRKEEMVNVFLKMKLNKEERNSGLNTSKLIDRYGYGTHSAFLMILSPLGLSKCPLTLTCRLHNIWGKHSSCT